MFALIQWTLTSFLFACPLYLYNSAVISSRTLKFVLGIVCTIAFILPAVFRCSLYLQRAVLYLNFLDRASAEDLQHPQRYNFTNAKHVYVGNGDLQLGVWHILPDSMDGRYYSSKDWDDSLASGYPVVVYVHGNIGTRATQHRLELYKLLTSLDCHVITFDYRSYGDSTYSHPYERGLMEDGLSVYLWARERAQQAPMFVWGHSLGTGLATGLVVRATQVFKAPKGVILEAPFDNMPSEIKVHPFGTVFRVLPWYNYLFSRPYISNEEDFNSSQYILQYPSPTLILHAEDDGIIPAKLGVQLYNTARNSRKTSYGPVEIILFKSKFKYGHKFICRSPELPKIVESFISKFKSKEFPI